MRSLPPVIKEYRRDHYRIVGVEQTTNSQSLFAYQFQEDTFLVLGNERLGITEKLLSLLDDVVEIPVFGQPASYNVATSAIIVMYEYCRQFRE